MRTGSVVIAMVVSLGLIGGGCSFAFLQPLSSTYDGTSEPRCDSGYLWPALDGTAIALDLAAILQAASEDGPGAPAVIGLSSVDAVVSLASMLWGMVKVGECKRAKAEWAEVDHGPVDPRWYEPPAPPPKPAPPRSSGTGFYCTTSADGSVGACSRTLEGCERQQSTIVTGGIDAHSCEAVTGAVCFGATRGDKPVESCFPTFAICDAQRALKLAKPDEYADVGACLGAE